MKLKSLLIVITLLSYSARPTALIFGQNVLEKKQYSIKSQISEADKMKVFRNCREDIERLYFDSTFNGKDLAKLRESYGPQVLAAQNKFELSQVLNKFVSELNTSHLKVTFEIGLRGKTLEEIFGEKINYRQNNIVFGYGYSITKFNEASVVTRVFTGSSAEQFGVKPGWIVKSCQIHPLNKIINSELVFTETADCVFTTENETDLKLTLSSSWFLLPHSNTQRISRSLAGNILYLKFTEFDKGLGRWLGRQLTAHPSATALIIDLRDNFGGLREEVKESLSLFLPPQTAVGEFIERDAGKRLSLAGSGNYYRKPVVILIDGNSTSGAEIFAAAFRDLERGKIIGYRSPGSVLNSIEKSLSNGFRLQIAVRDYKTVKGIRPEGLGIKPDFEIPFEIEDFRQNHDAALKKALEFLRN